MKIKNFLRKPSQTFASLRKSQLVSTLILSSFLFGMAFFLQSQTSGCCNGGNPNPTSGLLYIPYPTPDYNSEMLPFSPQCQFNSYLEPFSGQNHSLFNYNTAQNLDVTLVVSSNNCYLNIYENAFPSNSYPPLNGVLNGSTFIDYPTGGTNGKFDINFFISRRCNGCTSAPTFGKKRKWQWTMKDITFLPDTYTMFNVFPFKDQLTYTTSIVNCDAKNI